MSNQWLRWHIGTCEDGKFRMVSRKAAVTVGNAMALWATLLEDASHPDHRGVCTRGEDFYGAILDLEFEEVVAILSAMESVGMISVGHGDITVCNWNKRQFESDATDPTNAERQRRYKEKKKQNNNKTASNGSVTVEKHQIQNTDTDNKDNPQNEEFEKRFWLLWPQKRRCEKPKAFAAWKDATKKIDSEKLELSVRKYLQSDEAKPDRQGQIFVPYPAKWLKSERWIEFESSAPHAAIVPLETLLRYHEKGIPMSDAQKLQVEQHYLGAS